MSSYFIESCSVSETLALGQVIGEVLRGGEVFAINGALGTGKTHLIKGISVGAGVLASQMVNSPTFMLINEYESRLTLYHIDAYRLESAADLEQLGFGDLLGPGSVVLIEWAERVISALSVVPYIQIKLSHLGATQRHIEFHRLPSYLSTALANFHRPSA